MVQPLVSLDLASAHLYLSVVELGSITKAAARHGLSQPAASQRIRKLESQVGLRLLDRSATGSIVTADGREIAQRWRTVIADAAEVDAEARALRDRRNLRATVAVTERVARELLPHISAALDSDGEPIVVEPLLRSTAEACALVRDSTADLALVDGPAQPLALGGEIVATAPLVAFVSRRHPWARRRRPVGAAELIASPLVLRRRGSGTRDVIEESLSAAGYPIVVPALNEVDSVTELVATVTLGDGLVGIAAPAAIETGVESRALSVVATDVVFEQPIWMVWSGRTPSAPAARRFADAARSISP